MTDSSVWTTMIMRDTDHYRAAAIAPEEGVVAPRCQCGWVGGSQSVASYGKLEGALTAAWREWQHQHVGPLAATLIERAKIEIALRLQGFSAAGNALESADVLAPGGAEKLAQVRAALEGLAAEAQALQGRACYYVDMTQQEEEV